MKRSFDRKDLFTACQSIESRHQFAHRDSERQRNLEPRRHISATFTTLETNYTPATQAGRLRQLFVSESPLLAKFRHPARKAAKVRFFNGHLLSSARMTPQHSAHLCQDQKN
jgi:hypothetical protein